MADFSQVPPEFAAPAQLQMLREAQAQAAMQSRMAQMEEERARMGLEQTRADQPLLNQQRQFTMGQVGGALARQPADLEREAILSQGALQRAPAEVRGAQQDADAKVRLGNMKQLAEQMDAFIAAFEPVIRTAKTADFAASNEAWENAFELMEKQGHDVSKFRLLPRDQALAKVQAHYDQAVNNAPAIRERIRLDEAHQRTMEVERLRARSREAVARERVTSDRPVNTTDAAGARLLDKYNKNPESLTAENRKMLRAHLENQMVKLDPELTERWEERAMRLGKQWREEQREQNKPFSTEDYLEKVEEYIRVMRSRYMRQNIAPFYPTLYPEVTAKPTPAPAAAGSGKVVDFSQLNKSR